MGTAAGVTNFCGLLQDQLKQQGAFIGWDQKIPEGL
jgi:hypothetical protein